MEVVHLPSTPIQQQYHHCHKSDTKAASAEAENHAPEVVQQYQDGDKIGSPALLIYSPQTPQSSPTPTSIPPLNHQPTSWRRPEQQQPIHSPFRIVPPYYYPHGDSPTLVAPPVDTSPIAHDDRDSEKQICGVGRKVFVVLLVLAWLIVIGVGVGVGVKIGVVDQNRSANYEESPELDNGNSSLECPSGANTQITTTSGVEFIHLCAVDYSGRGQATDIAHERTPTFRACLEACARTSGCTGAGWGPRLAEEPARGTCWMKNNLNVSHVATGDFNFGIRLG